MPNKNFPLSHGHRERLISAMDDAIALVNDLVDYYNLQHPETTDLMNKLKAIRDELQHKNDEAMEQLKKDNEGRE